MTTITMAAPATAPEPVAWLAHYVGRSGMEQEYVSTDKNLADENDASGKALPLYLHPPATAPEQKPLVVMWAMYFRGYPEEPECKPAFMEDWRVYSDAASWDAEIDRANRNYQNHDNPTPGWLPYEARPVYVYAEAQPAIAPEPSWQDAPTCAGLWFCDEGDENPYRFTCHNVSIPLNPYLVGEGERWYGPIPPDGDKP